MLTFTPKYTHKRATRDPEGHVHHSVLLGATAMAMPLPDTVLLPDRIYNQGAAGSCWSYGYGKAPEAWALAHGDPNAVPVASLAAYKGARMMMAADPNAALTDDGTDPAVGVEFLAKYGVMAEADYPYTDQPPFLNERIEIAQLEQMAIAKCDGFTWIKETGDAKVVVIKTLLANKIHVPFGMSVDADYENLARGQVYYGPLSASLGGHAQRLSGYMHDPVTGKSKFRVTGSWDVEFAEDGYAWLGEDFVRSDQFWDACGLKWSPVVKGAS